MRTLLAIGCAAAIMSCALAQAAEEPLSSTVSCRNGNMTRIVETVYTGAPGEPPCQVHYRKTTEHPGHDQILWSSEHTKDYCENKQKEFVEMLKGLGWTCE
jgi:hypothetical protein